MANNAEKIREIFEQRMALVGKISQLNAAQLKTTQQLSGTQLDIQRHADSDDQPAADEKLAETKALEAQLISRMNDCEEQRLVLEQQVADLDRKLEAL